MSNITPNQHTLLQRLENSFAKKCLQIYDKHLLLVQDIQDQLYFLHFRSTTLTTLPITIASQLVKVSDSIKIDAYY